MECRDLRASMSPVNTFSRQCAVCGSARKTELFRQEFSGLSSESLLHGYLVVVCSDCGFAYADQLPEQDAFDAYYRNMSKYEQQHSRGEGVADLRRCESTVNALTPFLPDPNVRILDIGCATGRMLGLLKQRGYSNVLGIDPSETCVRLAQELYGVKVLPYTISTMPDWRENFDVVLLVAVIEHVQHLHPLLDRVGAILAPQGLLLVEHPDVRRFTPQANGPFQEFSTEHISFFSARSLENLMQHHGFTAIHSFQEDRPSVEGVLEPSSTSIFRKTGARQELVRDTESEPALRAYIAQCQSVEDHIKRTIDRLVETATPLIVWGTGTHTQRLMATSRLRSAKIAAFIDSNPRYQGKQLNGIPIAAPELLRERHEAILISSRIWQRDIANQIRASGYKNELILLYPEAGGGL